MVVWLLLSLIIGWLMGGVGNWLADQLPHLPQHPLHFAREHYLRQLTLPWFWRGRANISSGDAVSGNVANGDVAADVANGDVINAELRPWRRTWLMVGMAGTFALAWLRFGDDLGQLLVAWFYIVWLLVVLVIDLEHRRVLNLMLPPAILVAFLAPLVALLTGANLPTFSSMLLGGVAGFLAFFFVFVVGRGRMMGAGDVKLAGVIGLMVGYPMVWAALATGIFLGGIVAIFLIVRCRATGKSYMAYGPYLALGALLVLFIYWP